LIAIIQPFARATLLKGAGDVAYILYHDGTWATITP
jgi:hypothetical protein